MAMGASEGGAWATNWKTLKISWLGWNEKSPHESDGPLLAVLLAALVRGAAVTPHAVIGMIVILVAAFVGRRMS